MYGSNPVRVMALHINFSLAQPWLCLLLEIIINLVQVNRGFLPLLVPHLMLILKNSFNSPDLSRRDAKKSCNLEQSRVKSPKISPLLTTGKKHLTEAWEKDSLTMGQRSKDLWFSCKKQKVSGLWSKTWVKRFKTTRLWPFSDASLILQRLLTPKIQTWTTFLPAQ